MIDIKSLAEKVESLEAQCKYLGIVGSAMLRALPDQVVFLTHLEQERQMQNANALYSTSLSDRQRQTIDAALEALVEALSPKPDLPD